MNRTPSFRFTLALVLPLAVGALALVPAVASASPPEASIAATPASFEGTFQRYLLTPHGKIEGIMLANGTAVRVPPPAFQQDATNLRAGAIVHIEGRAVQTPTGTVISRPLIQFDGRTIADARNFERQLGRKHGEGHEGGRDGQHRHDGEKLAPMQETARVAALVANGRGHVDMLLLDDGTMVTAHHAGKLGLKVGDQVAVTGRGGSYPFGKAMWAKTITLPSGEVRELDRPRHGVHRHGGPALGDDSK